MEEFISKSVSQFSQFLSEQKSFLKQHKSDGVLVSLKLPEIQYDLSKKLDYLLKLYEKSFYFEKPQDDFVILGIDEIVSIAENGNGRFAATERYLNNLKKSFLCNWDENDFKNTPLFVGGMKFSVEHADETWKDFTNDAVWFVPELLILKQNNKTSFFYNFIYSINSSENKLKSKLQNKLEVLTMADEFVSENSKSELRNVEGVSPKDKKKFKQVFNQVIDNIYSGDTDKIVISRKVDLLLSEEPNLNNIIENLRTNYPACHTFVFHSGRSSFFGATPEVLARFSGDKITIDALAGSAPRGKDADEDSKFENEELKLEKNRNEHNFVVEYIKEALTDYVNELSVSDEVSVKKLSYIQHLYTELKGELKEKGKMFTLLDELFPTPAVCGTPKNRAIQLIKKIENHRRGLYSGIIGWFNFNDKAEFTVAIRSAITFGNKVVAYAGSGIVEDSDFEDEYRETDLKLKPILALFNEDQ